MKQMAPIETSLPMIDEESLRADVAEASAKLHGLVRARRDWLVDHTSDSALETLAAFLNPDQQERYRKLSDALFEAKRSLQVIQTELNMRFPVEPELPPAWHLSEDQIRELALKTGKSMDAIKMEFRRLGGIPAQAGSRHQPDRAELRNSEDGIDKTNEVGRSAYVIPGLSAQELIDKGSSGV